ncbi:MAG: DUF4398 domain-containing protein [Burkholderiaceae bacterium]
MNAQSRLNRRTLFVPAILSCAVLLGGCASQGKPPVADLAIARTSVSQAEAAGAAQYAPVEFLSARDKLARAESAMREERYNDARRLTDEAAADADVAERKSRAVKSANAAMELQRSNSVLGNELNRATTRP